MFNALNMLLFFRFDSSHHAYDNGKLPAIYTIYIFLNRILLKGSDFGKGFLIKKGFVVVYTQYQSYIVEFTIYYLLNLSSPHVFLFSFWTIQH